MSLEGWKTLFELGGVILLFLTFVFGAGALFTGTKINERQAGELRQFEAKLTDAQTEMGKQQERAANAEARLSELQRQRLPRMLQLTKFIEALKPKPHATAEIMYKKDDGEAFSLAWQINGGLSAAEWEVSRPVPIPEGLTSGVMSTVDPDLLHGFPLSVRIGAQPMGVTIIARTLPANPAMDVPFNALTHALSESLGQVYGGFDPVLPEDSIRIIVLQKP